MWSQMSWHQISSRLPTTTQLIRNCTKYHRGTLIKFCTKHRATLTNSSPLVPQICVRESGQHWFRYWLVAYSAPSHYVNHFWFIVNWILSNKLQWHISQNTKCSIHKNAFEKVVGEMNGGGESTRCFLCYWRARLVTALWSLMNLCGEFIGDRWIPHTNGQ